MPSFPKCLSGFEGSNDVNPSLCGLRGFSQWWRFVLTGRAVPRVGIRTTRNKLMIDGGLEQVV